MAMRMSAAPMLAAQVMAVCVGCSKTDSSGADPQGNPIAQGAIAQTPVAARSAEKSAIPVMTLGPLPAVCALVSDNDMTTSLGAVFAKDNAQPPDPNPSSSTCHYHHQELKLSVGTEPSGKRGYEKAKAVLPGGEDVPDLGDAAYFHHAQDSSDSMGILLVLKGGTLLTLRYDGFNVGRSKLAGEEKLLAAKLVPKL